MREVVDDRDREPAVVDAAVRVEGPVLGVDRRRLQPDADLAQRHHRAVLVIDGRDQVAVAINDPGGLLKARRLQLIDGGQVTREVVHHAEGAASAQQPGQADRDQRDHGPLDEEAAARAAASALGLAARL